MPRMEDAGGSVQGKDAGEMRGRPLPSDTAEVALQVSLTGWPCGWTTSSKTASSRSCCRGGGRCRDWAAVGQLRDSNPPARAVRSRSACVAQGDRGALGGPDRGNAPASFERSSTCPNGSTGAHRERRPVGLPFPGTLLPAADDGAGTAGMKLEPAWPLHPPPKEIETLRQFVQSLARLYGVTFESFCYYALKIAHADEEAPFLHATHRGCLGAPSPQCRTPIRGTRSMDSHARGPTKI